jgi:hypothetical protein
MEFLSGVAFTLLLETVALIYAAERMRREIDENGKNA